MGDSYQLSLFDEVALGVEVNECEYPDQAFWEINESGQINPINIDELMGRLGLNF